MKDVLESVVFYEKILFHNAVEEYMNTFLNNPRFIKERFFFYEPEWYWIKDEMIIDDNENSKFRIEIVDKEDYLLLWLKSNAKFLFKELFNISSNEESIDLNLKILYSYFSLILKENKLRYFNLFCEHFFDIIKVIESLNFENKLKHFYELKNNLGKGIQPFDLKECYKMPFLHRLYDLMLDLNLINEDLYENTFINVFTGYSKEQILFQKDTHYIVYFLDSIKPFFENLTPLRIEKTKLLCTKNRTQLKINNIHTSRSRLKNDKYKIDIKFKLKIDDFLAKNLI